MASDEMWPDQFLSKLGSLVPDVRRCRYCNHSEMTLNTNTVVSMVYKNGSVHANSFIPFGMLMCSYCGNTQMFNLLHLGVAKNDGDQTT